MAVAANAAEAVEALAADFEERTGHRVAVTVGSTGKLYAQILHGAPFDVFLAADQERPRLLVEQGIAVEGSRVTYAVGRLVLWSPDPEVDAAAETLREGAFWRLAIANPDLAPYGAAARETLQELGLWKSLRGKIVVGENVGQAFAMAASGNAELGFVSLASALSPRHGREGSYWEIPEHLHTPRFCSTAPGTTRPPAISTSFSTPRGRGRPWSRSGWSFGIDMASLSPILFRYEDYCRDHRRGDPGPR